MDRADPNDLARRRTVLRFGPQPWQTGLIASAAVGAAFGAIITSDGRGRLLLIIAGVLLGGYALTDVLFRPRISATADGLAIRAPGGSARLAWTDVERLHAEGRLRLGLRSVTLEIETETGLFVFSRRALGVDPETAADLLAAMDPRR